MWFLPFDLLKIESNLPVEEIFFTLGEVIDSSGYQIIRLAPPPDHKPYRGSFDEKGFVVSRWIEYKNPFLPVIIGNFSFEKSKNTISIKIFPNPLGTIIGISFIPLPFGLIDKQPVQIVISVLIYIFFLFVYKVEAIQAIDFFKKILKK